MTPCGISAWLRKNGWRGRKADERGSKQMRRRKTAAFPLLFSFQSLFAN